jgi:hypothetical protein
MEDVSVPGAEPGPLPGAAGALPLLLLDVDGVLLVVRPSWDDPLDDDAIDLEPTIHPEAGAWLAELAGAFELVWATTWEDMANRVIAPALGLPPLPAIAFDMDRHAPTAKLPSVIAWVGDRPCAWVDDDLGHDADTWAAGRTIPTLLVHTDMTRGMDRGHVDRLLAWGASLREG